MTSLTGDRRARWRHGTTDTLPNVNRTGKHHRTCTEYQTEQHANEKGFAFHTILSFPDALHPAIGPVPAYFGVLHTPYLAQLLVRKSIDFRTRLYGGPGLCSKIGEFSNGSSAERGGQKEGLCGCC